MVVGLCVDCCVVYYKGGACAPSAINVLYRNTGKSMYSPCLFRLGRHWNGELLDCTMLVGELVSGWIGRVCWGWIVKCAELVGTELIASAGAIAGSGQAAELQRQWQWHWVNLSWLNYQYYHRLTLWRERQMSSGQKVLLVQRCYDIDPG